MQIAANLKKQADSKKRNHGFASSRQDNLYTFNECEDYTERDLEQIDTIEINMLDKKALKKCGVPPDLGKGLLLTENQMKKVFEQSSL